MSNAGINPFDAFSSSSLNGGSGPNPFLRNCSHCHSEQALVQPISLEPSE